MVSAIFPDAMQSGVEWQMSVSDVFSRGVGRSATSLRIDEWRTAAKSASGLVGRV